MLAFGGASEGPYHNRRKYKNYKDLRELFPGQNGTIVKDFSIIGHLRAAR
jgi:hypothetical protein